MFAVTVAIFGTFLGASYSFTSPATTKNLYLSSCRTSLRMEYIPDGLSKREWEDLKKREAEEAKKRGNLGVMGSTRFRSSEY